MADAVVAEAASTAVEVVAEPGRRFFAVSLFVNRGAWRRPMSKITLNLNGGDMCVWGNYVVAFHLSP